MSALAKKFPNKKNSVRVTATAIGVAALAVLTRRVTRVAAHARATVADHHSDHRGVRALIGKRNPVGREAEDSDANGQ